ncbi:hypothetical protein ACPEIC_19070 [Stenotrophomonas sp. NPDC087984]
MSGEFWRTIQLAMEKDNWTARLVVELRDGGRRARHLRDRRYQVIRTGGRVASAAGWMSS